MTTTDAYIDPVADPQAAEAVAQMLNGGNTNDLAFPTITPPADDIVDLPGGLIQEGFSSSDELVATKAEVRELTGADEEAISKARSSRNLSRFPQTLVKCGLVTLGDQEPSAELIGDLFVGDHDAIILGIRRATYGNYIELENLTCPECHENFDLKLLLDDIPIRKLENPLENWKFTVPLRKGGTAEVRLPTMADFDLAGEPGNDSTAARNTVILSRCIRTIRRGEESTVVAGNKNLVSSLGLADRRAILTEITKRQPGPQYDEVKYTHGCGREMEVFLSLGDLFQDL